MKKSLSIILGVAFLITFVACGTSAQTGKSAGGENTENRNDTRDRIDRSAERKNYIGIC